MARYIDIQYFKVQDKIIVKELCVMIDNAIAHYLFKCPFDFNFLSDYDKRNVKWVESNYHQLKWSFGHTFYSELDKILASLDGVYICKGVEKCNFLRSKGIAIDDIDDVADFRTKFVRCKHRCIYHPHDSVCAMKNVKAYQFWSEVQQKILYV